MSIFALPADSASRLRAGIALELISWSRGFSLGYSTAVTWESFPLVTVIRTWTGPHRVSAASPVTVFDDEPGTLGADGSLPVFGVPPDVLGPVVLIAAGGFATDAECVLNDSRPTRPAIVPTMANATRRMTMSLFFQELRIRRTRGGFADAAPLLREAQQRPTPPYGPGRRRRRRDCEGRGCWPCAPPSTTGRSP